MNLFTRARRKKRIIQAAKLAGYSKVNIYQSQKDKLWYVTIHTAKETAGRLIGKGETWKEATLLATKKLQSFNN